MARTLTQNAALQLYAERLAEALNGAGYMVRAVMESRLSNAIIEQTMAWEASSNELVQQCAERIAHIVEMHTASADVPWTKDSIRTVILHGFMKKMFDITSTTKLETKQVSELYESINLWTSERFGISIPFPSNEPPMI